MWEIWWVWIALALILAIIEVVVPGFIFLGFAIGAAAVGVLMAFSLTFSLPWALVVFAVVSAVAWIALRRFIGIRKGQVKIWDTDINEN